MHAVGLALKGAIVHGSRIIARDERSVSAGLENFSLSGEGQAKSLGAVQASIPVGLEEGFYLNARLYPPSTTMIRLRPSRQELAHILGGDGSDPHQQGGLRVLHRRLWIAEKRSDEAQREAWLDEIPGHETHRPPLIRRELAVQRPLPIATVGVRLWRLRAHVRARPESRRAWAA